MKRGYFVYQNDRKASASAYDTTERKKLWSLLAKLAPEAASEWDRLE
jgi:hypothetical protein